MLVWVGRGPAGPRDGRIALYRREQVAELHEPGPDGEPPSELHRLLLSHLRERGASFLMELIQAVEHAGLEVQRGDFEAALWDLVWAGRITNDTLAPLRGLGGGARRRRREPALAGGRWSLVSDLLCDIPDTQRLLARARMLAWHLHSAFATSARCAATFIAACRTGYRVPPCCQMNA